MFIRTSYKQPVGKSQSVSIPDRDSCLLEPGAPRPHCSLLGVSIPDRDSCLLEPECLLSQILSSEVSIPDRDSCLLEHSPTIAPRSPSTWFQSLIGIHVY